MIKLNEEDPDGLIKIENITHPTKKEQIIFGGARWELGSYPWMGFSGNFEYNKFNLGSINSCFYLPAGLPTYAKTTSSVDLPTFETDINLSYPFSTKTKTRLDKLMLQYDNYKDNTGIAYYTMLDIDYVDLWSVYVGHSYKRNIISSQPSYWSKHSIDHPEGDIIKMTNTDLSTIEFQQATHIINVGVSFKRYFNTKLKCYDDRKLMYGGNTRVMTIASGLEYSPLNVIGPAVSYGYNVGVDSGPGSFDYTYYSSEFNPRDEFKSTPIGFNLLLDFLMLSSPKAKAGINVHLQLGMKPGYYHKFMNIAYAKFGIGFTIGGGLNRKI